MIPPSETLSQTLSAAHSSAYLSLNADCCKCCWDVLRTSFSTAN